MAGWVVSNHCSVVSSALGVCVIWVITGRFYVLHRKDGGKREKQFFSQ